MALVFAIAGVAKLSDREGSRRAIVDFGVPLALATPSGCCFPWQNWPSLHPVVSS